MDAKLERKDEILEAHRSALIVASLLFIALIVETLVMQWETWAVAYLLVGILLMWICHFSRTISLSHRVPMYVVIILGTFFFYGIHKTSLFDVPIIGIIMLSVFLMMECDWAIYLGGVFYFLVLAWQFFVLRNTDVFVSTLEVSRMIMDIVAVLIATVSTKDASNRRKKYQERVVAAVTELEEMNRQTENFMANVSHELRTPINAVSGIGETLLKKEQDPQKRKELFAIKRAGQRLFYQISDILDYTEMGLKRLKVSEGPYSIASTVNDIVTALRDRDDKPSVELLFDVDPRVPSVLLGDEGKIRKILRHLIENSIKYTQEGAVYVKICSFRKDYGANLFISVADTGVGMSEEQLHKIFGKLYQVEPEHARKSTGIGLGLTVVYGLVQSMGGFIQIESEVGNGTEIHISIPQKVLDDTPCMVISNERPFCVAYYFRSEKFSNPLVREYYERLIAVIQESMPGTLIRTSDMAGLERISQQYNLTHIFTAQEEYEDNKAFFTDIATRIHVAVIVHRDFKGRSLGAIPVIRKPLFSLPLINVLNGEYHPEEPETGAVGQRFVCPGLRALVVDDDEMNLLVADGVLKDYQMQVTLAKSGREAIELCRTQQFDLLLLDHMMPEMDGVDCLQILRRLTSHAEKEMVAIAFTANAVSGAREFFLGEGFDEFISKPIELMNFERVLSRVLPASMLKPLHPKPLFGNVDMIAAAAGPDGAARLKLFHELYEALDTLEADKAEQLMQQLDELRYGGKTLEELLPGARDAVAQFEFTPVQELIGQLLHQLEAERAGGEDGR
ncbi:MAG: response regulator [Treponema sp.]|nr:response regulator [Treponema sp.]